MPKRELVTRKIAPNNKIYRIHTNVDFSFLNQFSLQRFNPFSNILMYWTDGKFYYTTCEGFVITRKYMKDHIFELWKKIRCHDCSSQLHNLRTMPTIVSAHTFCASHKARFTPSKSK